MGCDYLPMSSLQCWFVRWEEPLETILCGVNKLQTPCSISRRFGTQTRKWAASQHVMYRRRVFLSNVSNRWGTAVFSYSWIQTLVVLQYSWKSLKQNPKQCLPFLSFPNMQMVDTVFHGSQRPTYLIQWTQAADIWVMQEARAPAAMALSLFAWSTVKPVCNDHLYDKNYYMWFIQ